MGSKKKGGSVEVGISKEALEKAMILYSGGRRLGKNGKVKGWGGVGGALDQEGKLRAKKKKK